MSRSGCVARTVAMSVVYQSSGTPGGSEPAMTSHDALPARRVTVSSMIRRVGGSMVAP